MFDGYISLNITLSSPLFDIISISMVIEIDTTFVWLCNREKYNLAGFG